MTTQERAERIYDTLMAVGNWDGCAPLKEGVQADVEAIRQHFTQVRKEIAPEAARRIVFVQYLQDCLTTYRDDADTGTDIAMLRKDVAYLIEVKRLEAENKRLKEQLNASSL